MRGSILELSRLAAISKMSLPAETQLGPYKIVAPIGAGAMGEVDRARDTRLQRDVALKTLPASWVRDLQVEIKLPDVPPSSLQIRH
jgi:hypothetical protein